MRVSILEVLIFSSLLSCRTESFSIPGNLIPHSHVHVRKPLSSSKTLQKGIIVNQRDDTLLHAFPVAAAAVSTSAKATVGTFTFTSFKQAFSSTLSSLHGDPFYILSSMLLLSTFGIILEKRTTIGKALSVSNTIIGS